MQLPFERTDAKRINDTLKAAGTFWSDKLANRGQAYHLVGACYKTAVLDRLTQAVDRMDSKSEIVNNVVLEFDPLTVAEAPSTSLDQSILMDTMPGMAQSISQLNEGNRHYWAVQLQPAKVSAIDPKTFTIEPLRIDCAARPLVLNVDYYVRNDLLLFQQDPRNLFPDSIVPVAVAKLYRSSIHGFQLDTTGLKDPSHVTRYVRVSQSLKDFELAAASVAGLEILPEAATLEHIANVGSTTAYSFDKFSLRVAYEHTPMVVGTHYPKHYIIGEGLKMHYNDGRGSQWWKKVDFKGGLVMGGLTGDNGLVIPDRYVEARLDEGNHLWLALQGPDELVDEYWARVAAAENAAGKYLNDVAGLSEGESTSIHALDLFFNAFLDRKLVIVSMKGETLPSLDRVKSFINTHKPTGCLVLMLISVPEISDTVSFDTVVEDEVSVYPVGAYHKVTGVTNFISQTSLTGGG